MVKYVTTAMALKCFSATPLTRRVYRQLGNHLGNVRRRSGSMPRYYADRLMRMLRLAREHHFVRDGDRILELGTGWLHWEALTLRLFFDIHAVLFDVWDNRQLGALQSYLRQLSPFLREGVDLTSAQVQRGQRLIDHICAVTSFDELYSLLGFTYVVDSSGSLKQFQDESFDLVVSAGVLEHIKVLALQSLVADTHRLLKPGGWVLHSIDTSDHLAHYDTRVSKKKYLSFSDATWSRCFENEVQYINRVQRGSWLELFASHGFALVEEELHNIDLSGLKIASNFVGMERRDLECTTLRVALRKRA